MMSPSCYLEKKKKRNLDVNVEAVKPHGCSCILLCLRVFLSICSVEGLKSFNTLPQETDALTNVPVKIWYLKLI